MIITDDERPLVTYDQKTRTQQRKKGQGDDPA